MTKINLNAMLENCIVEKQENGLHSVWMNDNPRRGQILDCEGSNRFEIIEDAYHYLEDIKIALGKDDL